MNRCSSTNDPFWFPIRNAYRGRPAPAMADRSGEPYQSTMGALLALSCQSKYANFLSLINTILSHPRPGRVPIQVLLMGDGNTGKTTAVRRFVGYEVAGIETYHHNVQDTYQGEVNIGGNTHRLEITDTIGLVRAVGFWCVGKWDKRGRG